MAILAYHPQVSAAHLTEQMPIHLPSQDSVEAFFFNKSGIQTLGQQQFHNHKPFSCCFPKNSLDKAIHVKNRGQAFESQETSDKKTKARYRPISETIRGQTRIHTSYIWEQSSNYTSSHANILQGIRNLVCPSVDTCCIFQSRQNCSESHISMAIACYFFISALEWRLINKSPCTIGCTQKFLLILASLISHLYRPVHPQVMQAARLIGHQQ